MDMQHAKDYTFMSDISLMHELYRRYRCQNLKSQKRVLLLGMPGAGKGTHAFKLLQRFCMCHLSTGDMLREEVRSGSEFGKQLKTIMDSGDLIQDEIMCSLIQTNLKRPECAKGAILDGFPRTIPQAEKLDQILEKNHQSIDLAIYLNAKENTVLERLGGRWTHLPSGRTYHYKFNPPKTLGQDDITGEKLVQREDDKVETIKKRLHVFQTRTFPICDYYKAAFSTKSTLIEQLLMFGEILRKSCWEEESLKINDLYLMDNNKDQVQNTIKNLQEKISSIETMLEKGTDCIVLQYGSHSIKFNRAHEVSPKKIRNLIAYRVATQRRQADSPDYSRTDNATHEMEDRLITKGAIKAQPKSLRGKPRAKIEVDLRNIRNLQKHITEDVAFEDDVFLFESRPDYIVRQPIKHGQFNLQTHTIQDVIEDLYKLTMYAMNNKLGIATKDLQNYNCILVIPDVFHRGQVKALVDLLIRQVGFKAIYLHQESVLASFGSNLPSCCVVDIGSEKINICCVDDGVILPGTYMRKNFGMNDIDKLLLRQIVKRNAFDGNLHTHNYGDMQQMEKLREKACLLVQKDDKLNYLYELHCVRDGKESKFLVQHNDGLYVVPNALFAAQPFNELRQTEGSLECFDYTSRLYEMNYDPEDNLEELSGGVQLSWLWGSKERELQFSQQQDLKELLHPDYMVPLETMISICIAQVPDSEIRQKMANNILFVGGGTQLADLVDELEALLIDEFQKHDLSEIERVEVKVIPKPINLAWVGAALLTKTESMPEMWISAARWLGNWEPLKDEMEEILNNFDGDVPSLEKKIVAFVKKDKEKDRSSEYGIKHLKEKIAFIW